MSRDWESWLASAARGPSQTEKDERDRTEARIRRAIADDPDLSGNVRVFVKGSYANNTNVRADADVDIAVEWNKWAYVDHAFQAKGLTAAQVGYTTVSEGPDPSTYRGWVNRALVNAFGGPAVHPGNKAILVDASTSTLDADVVPCFRHNRYDRAGATPKRGIELHPKDGGVIINWPDQNLENGRRKNNATSRSYKQIVRAVKRLENDMVEKRILSKDVPSFLIECLLWNVPDARFTSSSSYLETVRKCFRFLWTPLRENQSEEWGEVNELKYLFRSSQKWTRQDAFNFIDKAWDTIGVE
jgi:hypothetical protein